MSETEIFLKVLDKVTVTYGGLVGFFLLVLSIALTLILAYFKKRIGAIADEISQKSVSAFDKKLEILFRDEVLRNNLRTYLGQRSMKKKLELYQAVYSLYFQYQRSWFFNKQTPEEEFSKLWTDITIMRQRIFLDSIYLGGTLYDALRDTVIGMLNNLDDRGKNPAKQQGIIGITSITTGAHSEIDVTKPLDIAAQWLQKNLFTDQNLSMYEFTEEQSKRREAEQKVFLEQHLAANSS
jgi:hypothetical protein